MMDINEFAKAVTDRLTQADPVMFPAYRISVEEVTRNNGVVYHGVTVVPEGDGAAPIIYLENEWHRYLDGEDLEAVCLRIREAYGKGLESMDREMPDLPDKEGAKDMLRVDLVDIGSNRELLKSMVSRDVGCGYALTAFLDLPEGSPISGRIRLTKELAEDMGYTETELMDEALRCGKRNAPAVLGQPDDIVYYGPGEKDVNMLSEPGEAQDGLLVLTTTDRYMGAAALFYPEVKEQIAEAIGGRDYFVLPSSVHEILIVPDTGDLSAKALAFMVFDTNIKLVDREERLGNRVLRYSRESKELSVAEDLDRYRSMDMER